MPNGMARLKYGLTQVNSACLRARIMGWISASKNQIRLCVKCKNQILNETLYNAKPYHKIAIPTGKRCSMEPTIFLLHHQSASYMKTVIFSFHLIP